MTDTQRESLSTYQDFWHEHLRHLPEAQAHWAAKAWGECAGSRDRRIAEQGEALRQAEIEIGILKGNETSLTRNLFALREEVERLKGAIREVWPHLTGHCFEGSTPACYGTIRDTLSAVVDGLPYAALNDAGKEG